MSKPPLLAYFGHHKCATTWIHSILGEYARRTGLNHAYFHSSAKFGGDLRAHLDRNRVELLSYVNAEIEQVAQLGSYRGFHVVRDPRDLIVSAYYSHLHSHDTHDWPALIEHRADLEKATKQDGLYLEMEFSSGVLDQMYRWDYEQLEVLELRQEELTRSPYRGFLRIFEFMGLLDAGDVTRPARIGYGMTTTWNRLAARSQVGLPRRRLRQVPGEDLLSIVYGHRFRRLTAGRDRGTEDSRSHYRSGVPGDWRNHLDEGHVAEFKTRFNDVVLKLGYETTAGWS